MNTANQKPSLQIALQDPHPCRVCMGKLSWFLGWGLLIWSRMAPPTSLQSASRQRKLLSYSSCLGDKLSGFIIKLLGDRSIAESVSPLWRTGSHYLSQELFSPGPEGCHRSSQCSSKSLILAKWKTFSGQLVNIPPYAFLFAAPKWVEVLAGLIFHSFISSVCWLQSECSPSFSINISRLFSLLSHYLLSATPLKMTTEAFGTLR